VGFCAMVAMIVSPSRAVAFCRCLRAPL